VKVYHCGFTKIETPDLNIGRDNADLGKGFYLSDDMEFSMRWAKIRHDMENIINIYELDLADLNVKRFERDGEWFSCIAGNRRGEKDLFMGYDVLIAPIANDTLFDTFGIITSGILDDEQGLYLLKSGPCYKQIVIKSGKALSHLKWIGSENVDMEKVAVYREKVKEEERSFQEDILSKLQEME